MRDEHATQLQKSNLTQDTNSSCPLCEQSLSAARKRFLQTKIEDTIQVHTHRLARLKKILPHLKTLLVDDYAALQIMAQQKTELHTLQHTQALDIHKKQSILELIKTINNNYLELKTQEENMAAQKHALSKIKSDDIKTTEMRALETKIKNSTDTLIHLKQELNALSYNSTHITQLHANIQKLQQELNILEKNKQNLELQQERTRIISHMCIELKKEKIDLSKQKQTESTLITAITALEQLIIQEATVTECIKKLSETRENLLIEQGKYQAAQRALAITENNIAQHTAILEKTESDMSNYQIIATALGKDGIQALLIEEIIPEIEENANAFLAKLTNNNAHIIIESLRDLKNGGTKETLDIKISDAQGVRPYEMFSGGETFRIDFALRIAISKLLAHRAGAALQTLIIDEGFGSQDEEGLSAIMDLLYTLQGEFAKIIVVSHLPTMKDQFPVHLHVEKGSHGSIVHCIEQG